MNQKDGVIIYRLKKDQATPNPDLPINKGIEIEIFNTQL